MMEKDPLESSRVEALDMLKGTKVETTNCFKTVAECIENNIIEIMDFVTIDKRTDRFKTLD
jgi:hypothetical protein